MIPAHNEEGCIESTCTALLTKLEAEQIAHEVLVINDNSRDQTENLLTKLSLANPNLKYINNVPPHGFGFAVRKGLENFSGDAVAVYMADASDSPDDLVKFFRQMQTSGAQCVFGTRWSRGGKTFDYPVFKRVINRFANWFIGVLFGYRYNDTTNAFKLYKKEVIAGVKPFLSHHFNLTVEIPLKAIIRGFSYEVLPNSWVNRKTGESKLKIKEMGSRYLFVVLYCFIEKWLSQGDYKKK